MTKQRKTPPYTKSVLELPVEADTNLHLFGHGLKAQMVGIHMISILDMDIKDKGVWRLYLKNKLTKEDEVDYDTNRSKLNVFLKFKGDIQNVIGLDATTLIWGEICRKTIGKGRNIPGGLKNGQ